MAVVLSLADVKADLRVSGNDQDADITLKLSAAHGIIMKHIKHPDLDTWDVADIDVLRAAELIVVRNLFDEDSPEPLSPPVRALLEGFRDPTLA